MKSCAKCLSCVLYPDGRMRCGDKVVDTPCEKFAEGIFVLFSQDIPEPKITIRKPRSK